FALYDFLICNTLKHRSVFAWHPQCLFIPWGTDTSLYQPKAEPTAQPGGVTFFHSAGMSPYRKGTDLLLQAFALLTGDAKLYLHSQVPLKTAFPQLTDNIDELLAKQQLFIHEGTVAAPGLYTKGDVYVYPSRLDGIGLTILEAASAGLPVIVPDYGPMNEFVAADINGRTVAIDKLWARWDGYYWPQCEVNIAALAAAMQSYVDNASSMPQYARQARQYAEKHFNWQHNSAELAQRLTQVTLQPADAVRGAEQQARKYDATLFQRHAKSARQRWKENFAEQNPVVYRLLHSLKSALKRG
ncbi:MAG: glycosyltransferase, partial [Gammaproteobacteria bacterium]|nr:glycosyltransferase [Gammaproteobacteria bacterium]MBU1556205.1 glycosyltransferase [Gammaproteobacteria bacterium]